MLVSVIITTKNEEKNIENCLKSIKDQSYSQDLLEIIVVDNKSDDKTKEIALQYTDKVFDKGPERSAQRNFGVEKASGEYFMYLDADMILHKDVINDCVEKISVIPVEAGIQLNNTVALYVSEIVMGDKFFSKVRRFERSFYDATVVDCARFIRKSSFQQVAGFDENLTGPEDWDLDKKLRNIGHIGLITTPIYHNEAEFDLGKYLSKKGYYAKKFDEYIEKWGKDDEDLKKQFGLYYRFFGIFTEKGKWKKMIAHPFLTFGMYFLRGLVGLKFITRKG
ncbi:MAG: Glycosyl transferase family 2 [Candidatus Moranbacteria bacterium GW2011_GWC2_37_8]|nr:MAG: Glycosyl transferase family 2 [Candidatus Moranbacteria bacterium GW2011_GWC2_37_8]KKQ62568.1 MAG: Glycosyl transferase family 2 [Parcubacteria group bacterium GW2011_GWC1_38_22]KKQ80731.1 MAG: Glycosyl transferase family 2 [Candidatus Moranbacteria bacterium GW2011_GWD2_38_7]